mmetsp:Transcript_21382/g.20536  ORF Transcript_21382/g.20536 Transcript_21382/m.20536 type:complete len:175 (+) Transcript_21382:3404-3928(+)
MLEAPMPLLVGITKNEYQCLIEGNNGEPPLLNEQERAMKTWVFLESKEIVWSEDVDSLDRFDFNNIRQRVKDEYEKFSLVNEFSMMESDQESSRSSSITDNDLHPMGNEELKTNTRSICEKIRKSFKDYIFGDLKNVWRREKYSGRLSKPHDALVKDVGDIVLRKSHSADRPFL